MTKPDNVTWTLGTDRHGRPVQLVGTLEPGGRYQFGLKVQATNQRDDTQTVDGLTVDLLIKALDAARMFEASQ